MPTHEPASLTPAAVLEMFRVHRRLWIATAVAGLVIAGVFSLMSAKKWQASQGLIARSEAAGYADQRLGKFTDLSEMKTVQETVLELARSSAVLSGALEQVGPRPSWFSSKAWPRPADVESLRDNLRIAPPGGAEFGTTEVFYLTITDTNRERAAALAGAVASQLEIHLQQLRKEQALGMARELENAVSQAAQKLEAETVRLGEFEAEVGADLAELRLLISPIGGQGELAQKALALEAELRQSALARRRGAQLLTALQGAASQPDRLLATPATLLASQPALERLKSGLVDAQLRTAQLGGSRSDSHPMVAAAREIERLMRDRLHRELPIALMGIELELTLAEQNEAALRGELVEARRRAAALAGKRASYAHLVAAVENQSRVVDDAGKQLADARAHAAGAATASVLNRVGVAEAGNQPVGPGRASVAFAGGLAGLVLGVGVVFLLHGPTPPAGAGGSVTRWAVENSRPPLPTAPFGFEAPHPFDASQMVNDYQPIGRAPAVTTTGAGWYGSTVCTL